MRIKLLVVAVTALVVWSLKRHYSDAGAEDLQWILAPTAWLSSVMTGTTFTWQHGEGYLSRERMFLIEKPCAGVNFLVAAFAMLTLSRMPRAASSVSMMRLISLSAAAAYAAAVIVNAARISIAIWLADYQAGHAGLSASDIHRMEGIVVYFGGLLLLHEGMRRFDRPVLAERAV